jgi:hypothetical protein
MTWRDAHRQATAAAGRELRGVSDDRRAVLARRAASDAAVVAALGMPLLDVADAVFAAGLQHEWMDVRDCYAEAIDRVLVDRVGTGEGAAERYTQARIELGRRALGLTAPAPLHETTPARTRADVVADELSKQYDRRTKRR